MAGVGCSWIDSNVTGVLCSCTDSMYTQVRYYHTDLKEAGVYYSCTDSWDTPKCFEVREVILHRHRNSHHRPCRRIHLGNSN